MSVKKVHDKQPNEFKFSSENLNSFGWLSYTFFTLIYLPLQKLCLVNRAQQAHQPTCGRE